jgi:acyl transferase domain-containing protein
VLSNGTLGVKELFFLSHFALRIIPGFRGLNVSPILAHTGDFFEVEIVTNFYSHGTGTPTGDPIECAAIGNVFAEGRTPNDPLLIGSIKTNLGHTEGASGLAGVIKAVLCLEKGYIPATVGVKRLNPNSQCFSTSNYRNACSFETVDFKNGRLRVVRSLTPWPDNLQYRRASVNGFGYGGANSCIVWYTSPLKMSWR